MKKIIILIIIFLFPQNVFADENIEKKAREINKKIRCVVCQSQSIDDSDSILARDLRLLIKEKLKEGSTEKEIYDFLKNQYGDWIVYDPKFDKKTLLLWGFPLVLFIFGGILIFRKVFIY